MNIGRGTSGTPDSLAVVRSAAGTQPAALTATPGPAYPSAAGGTPHISPTDGVHLPVGVSHATIETHPGLASPEASTVRWAAASPAGWELGRRAVQARGTQDFESFDALSGAERSAFLGSLFRQIAASEEAGLPDADILTESMSMIQAALQRPLSRNSVEAAVPARATDRPRTEGALAALVAELRNRPVGLCCGQDVESSQSHAQLSARDVEHISVQLVLRLPVLAIARRLPDIWRANGASGCLEILWEPRFIERHGVCGERYIYDALNTQCDGRRDTDIDALTHRLCRAIDGGNLAAHSDLIPVYTAISRIVFEIERDVFTDLIRRAVGETA